MQADNCRPINQSYNEAIAVRHGPEELDSRWLGDRVVAEAQSLAHRRAIGGVLELGEAEVTWVLEQLSELRKKRKTRRRR